MKRTILTAALFAFLGLATAQGSTILTFGDSADSPSWSTDNVDYNGKGNGPGSAWDGSSAVTTLQDGTVVTPSINGGKLWRYTPGNPAWSNQTVLDELNRDLGTAITGDDIAGLQYVASAAGGAHTTLSFNFTNNQVYTAGSKVVFYLLATTNKTDNASTNLTSFTVTGLTDTTTSWALHNGTGYESSTDINIPNDTLGLIKVEGVLGETQTVSFSSGSNKNAWAMVSYAPEPATATLSLLALAGLAARRRRK